MEAHRAPLGPRLIGRLPRRLAPAGDDRLARLVGSGSEEAFAILYERYHQRLYRYCRSMLGNDADAQDALQSAFAGAFTALAAGRRDAPVRPWLYRIAHNEAVSILRRRRPEVDLAEIETAASPSAADVAGEKERLARLVEDLGRLNERQRSALVMRELSGLSHDEIGVALGTDAGGAKQTIFEARRSLQEFAEGRDMPCDEVCRAISAGGGRTMRARRIRSHLHDCGSCRAFAAAIPSRSRDLRAIAPPLTVAAATGIFRRALSSSGHGGGGGAGVASAGKAIAVSALGKAATGAAVVATVAAGAAGVAHIASSNHRTAEPTPVSGPVAVSRAHTGAAQGARREAIPVNIDRRRIDRTRAAAAGRSGSHGRAANAAAASDAQRGRGRALVHARHVGRPLSWAGPSHRHRSPRAQAGAQHPVPRGATSIEPRTSSHPRTNTPARTTASATSHGQAPRTSTGTKRVATTAKGTSTAGQALGTVARGSSLAKSLH